MIYYVELKAVDTAVWLQVETDYSFDKLNAIFKDISTKLKNADISAEAFCIAFLSEVRKQTAITVTLAPNVILDSIVCIEQKKATKTKKGTAKTAKAETEPIKTKRKYTRTANNPKAETTMTQPVTGKRRGRPPRSAVNAPISEVSEKGISDSSDTENDDTAQNRTVVDDNISETSIAASIEEPEVISVAKEDAENMLYEDETPIAYETATISVNRKRALSNITEPAVVEALNDIK